IGRVLKRRCHSRRRLVMFLYGFEPLFSWAVRFWGVCRLSPQRRGMPVPTSALSILPPRERQLFASVLRGETTRQIAGALGLRYQTVKNYLTTIYDKLGVPNPTALCARFSQSVAGVSLEQAPASADAVTTE